jgi:hypothetical protein
VRRNGELLTAGILGIYSEVCNNYLSRLVHCGGGIEGVQWSVRYSSVKYIDSSWG